MEIYKQYAELKLQAELLDEQMKSVKEQIMSDMRSRLVSSEKHDYGSFTIASRKTYKYSKNVELMEESVKIAKIEEVERGIADVEEINYLTFKSPKLV